MQEDPHNLQLGEAVTNAYVDGIRAKLAILKTIGDEYN